MSTSMLINVCVFVTCEMEPQDTHNAVGLNVTPGNDFPPIKEDVTGNKDMIVYWNVNCWEPLFCIEGAAPEVECAKGHFGSFRIYYCVHWQTVSHLRFYIWSNNEDTKKVLLWTYRYGQVYRSNEEQ